MKKLVYIICIAFLVLGCGNNARVKQVEVSQELVSEGIIKNNLASDLPQPEEPKPVRDPDKPLYEGRWMELQETEDGYVVYNYQNLWYNDVVRFPCMRIIEYGKMVPIYYSDEINYNYVLPIKDVEQQGDGVYYIDLKVERANHLCVDSFDEADSLFKNSTASFAYGGKQIKFELVDKDNRIARITEYNVTYHAGELQPEIEAYWEELYIDSLYNKFPIIDYEWEWDWEN